MSLKKTDLYRGFNIYVDEIRAGVWGFSLVEVPSSEDTSTIRPPLKGRVPGEHQSREAAREAARAHVDRIHTNRKNRAGEFAR